jgi:hypothetical protein
MMQNPVPRSPMFATPVDQASLDAYIQRLPKSDRAMAYTVAMMTFNLCHKMVDDAKQEAKGAW